MTLNLSQRSFKVIHFGSNCRSKTNQLNILVLSFHLSITMCYGMLGNGNLSHDAMDDVMSNFFIMFFITIVDKRNNRHVQYNSKNQTTH